MDTTFQVVIEGVVGSSFQGDMAIDDTAFSSGCVRSNNGLVTALSTAPTTPATTISPCGANRFQ